MKKLLAAATLASVAVLALVAFAPTSSATSEANNWYVCKWVGPPGNDETLQTGQNPIFVDENAIMAETGLPTVSIGDAFADAQTHSRVIAGPYSPPGIDPEPVCPVTTPSTSPPPVSTTPPPVTTTPPPVTTTPPPVTTSPPPVTTTTAPPPPPSETTPPPVGGPGPGNPPNNPPPAEGNTPNKLAFTGIEDVLPIGALALALLGSGTGLVWFNRKRDE